MKDAAVDFSNEEITGRYEGEELETRRGARPPDERFAHLESKHDEQKRDVEKKHDELKKDVSEIRTDVKVLAGQVNEVKVDVATSMGDMRTDMAGVVGKIEGQEKVLTEVLSIVRDTASRESERQQAVIEISKEQELAKVEVSRTQELAKVEISKEHALDSIEAKKNRRTLIAKGAGLVLGSGGLIELLHRLGVL